LTINVDLPPNGGDDGTWGPVLNAAISDIQNAHNSHVLGADPHGDRQYADTNKLDKSQNLADIASPASARTALGLGTAAQASTTDFATPSSLAAAVAAAVAANRLVNL
jgi:hypothetical protein